MTTMENFLSSELIHWLQDNDKDSDQGNIIGPEQEQCVNRFLLEASRQEVEIL